MGQFLALGIVISLIIASVYLIINGYGWWSIPFLLLLLSIKIKTK